jgi:hypothetical protein
VVAKKETKTKVAAPAKKLIASSAKTKSTK